VTEPPRLARWLLERRLPPDDRGELVGDLTEQFHRQAARHGRARAARWFWRQVLGLIWGFAVSRGGAVSTAPQRMDGGSAGGGRMGGFVQDVRYAGRVLARNSSMTAVLIFTLALATGMTTAIFSVVYGVLLRPLPYPNPDRLMAIWEINTDGGRSRLADPNFDDFQAQNRSFQTMARYSSYVTSVVGGSEPTRSNVAAVSRDFLTVLGIQPVLGRGLTAGDARPGAAPIVLASYGYWQQYLDGARDLSALTLRMEDRVYAVVGVLPAGFHFPEGVDLWVPVELNPGNTSRTAHNAFAIGRLRDDVTAFKANADLSAIGRRIRQQSSDQNTYLLEDAAVVPLQESMTGRVRTPLLLLLAAVSCLLLVACANAANLLLSQATARHGELAIRNALGAGRARLLRQFLTEALLLSLLSAGAGVLVAIWGVDALLAMAPQNLPRLEDVGVNAPVLMFALGLALVLTAGLGVFTAVRSTSDRSRAALLERGRGQAGTQRNQTMGRRIVAAQVAVTFVLLVGAGLLGRSLLGVLSVDPGFRTDHIVAMDLSLPDAADEAARVRQATFFATLVDRLHAIPGVQQTGAASALPLSGGLPDGMFLLMSQEEAPKRFEDFDESLFSNKERTGIADFCVATSGYFRALGIPVIRGRLFDEHDGFGAPHVALISESLARTRWPNQDPLGRTIEFGNMDGDLHLLTIVGIVGDTHEGGLDLPPRPTVYVNLLQRPSGRVTAVMSAGADAGPVMAAARSVLHDLNPDIPLRFRTFSQVYAASLGSRTFTLAIVGVFAGSALLLAVAGIYGVMAYTVTRRTREIGVRMALGATPSDVLRMILGQGMATTIVGVGVGIAGALALTGTMASLLFGVTTTDPLTFAGVALLLATVAALACYVPARRAMRGNPVAALRSE
jgi:putative ABC transport system permease protein